MIGGFFKKRENLHVSGSSSVHDSSPLSASFHNGKSSPLSTSFNSVNKERSLPSVGGSHYLLNDEASNGYVKNPGINSSSYNNSNSNSSNISEPDNFIHNMPCLYGSDKISPTPSFKLSDKLSHFRMVIIQDAGIRNKQPLFDSAVAYNKNFSIMQQKLNKRIHHSMNELSVFMFGSYGMPLSEANMTTKVHYLPTLSNMQSSILITRLFSLDSSFTLKPYKIAAGSSDWEPHPLLKTDELPQFSNNSTRFAIGLVLPVNNTLESVRDEITENWEQISISLLSLQDLITKKLKIVHSQQNKSKKSQIQSSISRNNSSTLLSSMSTTCVTSAGNLTNSSNSTSMGPKNTKFSFQIYCLQTEMEVYQKFGSFISLIVSLLELPRIFIDLKHSNNALIHWASTVSLWLELKDGRVHSHDSTDCDDSSINYTESNASESFNSSSFIGSHHFSNLSQASENSVKSQSGRFLATLLSILLPKRNELFEDKTTDSTLFNKLRVIIATSNPLVSQKLIFILGGILGYEKFPHLYDQSQDLNGNNASDSESESLTKNTDEFTFATDVGHPLIYSNVSYDRVANKNDCFSQTEYFKDTMSSIPIPNAKASSNDSQFSRSVNTRNNSLVFESPLSNFHDNFKSSPQKIPSSPISASTISGTVSADVKSQRIPVPKLTRTSSYASLQNLSSSYGGSTAIVGSQDSLSSSWRNNFGSFMEKWRNSVSPSPTVSQVSQSPNTNTPSPTLDHEEYPWYLNKMVPTTGLDLSLSSVSSIRTSSTAQIENTKRSHISNHCTLTKISSVGNYKSHDEYEVARSTCNLIPFNSSKMLEQVHHEINSIMDGNFNFALDNSDYSVLNVSSYNDNHLPKVSSTNIKLPLLIGYSSQYRPEFNMMSCPNKVLQDSIFIETMKNDLKNPNIKNSDVYLINLGTRRVNHFEMVDNNKKISLSRKLVNIRPSLDPSLSMSDLNKPSVKNEEEVIENGPVTIKLKHTPRRTRSISNLTRTMDTGYELKHNTLFQPSKPDDSGILGMYKSGLNSMHSQARSDSDQISRYDEILEKIACSINTFFADIKQIDGSNMGSKDVGKAKVLESECCANIRKYITELLELSDASQV